MIIMGNGDKCTICLGKVSPYDNVTATRLPCTHLFHTDCINGWRECGKTTCPICRHPMENEEVDNDYNNEDDDDEEEEQVDNDDDDDEDEEPFRRSIPRPDENNQHNDMYWAVQGEPSFPSSPQQDWSNHASTYPPYLGIVGVPCVPFAQPLGEWAGYVNHSQISSQSWPVIGEPSALSPPKWGFILENHPQTSSLQLPVPYVLIMIMVTVFLVICCLSYNGEMKAFMLVSVLIWVIIAQSGVEEVSMY
ncbi:hypothetical protein ACLB2K_032957 [Fragaria x ananassa]